MAGSVLLAVQYALHSCNQGTKPIHQTLAPWPLGCAAQGCLSPATVPLPHMQPMPHSSTYYLLTASNDLRSSVRQTDGEERIEKRQREGQVSGCPSQDHIATPRARKNKTEHFHSQAFLV